MGAKLILNYILITITLILSISCDKKTDNSSSKGTVTLQLQSSLANQLAEKFGNVKPLGTCPSGLTCLTPNKFEMKILAAYVVEDVDPATSNNVGQVGMVWLNPGCTSINDCKPSKVQYSDLTDPTAFNAELNSQALSINTGTYKYVRLEFCQGSADSSNVKVTSSSTVKEFTYGGCGVTSVALASPITLSEGQSLTIEVSYDLSDGEVYCGNTSSPCAESDLYIGGIDLSPSIVQ